MLLLWWFRHLFVVLSLSAYATLAPFGYVGFAALALLKPGDEAQRARFVQGIIQRAFALMHHWLRLTRLLEFDPGHLRNRLPEGPFIIIANHPTLTDTTAIIGSVPRICAIVRSDIYEGKLVKPLFELAGYLNAGGRGVEAIARWIETARQRLSDGFSILIFPEGRRSPPGDVLRPMGRVAFELSCQSGVPILALTVREAPRWLGQGTSFLHLSRQVPLKTLDLLAVYNPEDFQGDSRKMRTAVEKDYLSALASTALVNSAAVHATAR